MCCKKPAGRLVRAEDHGVDWSNTQQIIANERKEKGKNKKRQTKTKRHPKWAFSFFKLFLIREIDREHEVEDALEVDTEGHAIFIEKQTSINYEYHRKVLFFISRQRPD